MYKVQALRPNGKVTSGKSECVEAHGLSIHKIRFDRSTDLGVCVASAVATCMLSGLTPCL